VRRGRNTQAFDGGDALQPVADDVRLSDTSIPGEASHAFASGDEPI